MPWMCDFIEWAQHRSTLRFKICLPFPSLHGLHCVLLEFTQSTAPQPEPQQQLPRDATYSHVLNQISKTVDPLVLQKNSRSRFKTYQSHPLQSLLEFLLSLPLPQYALQFADQLCGKPLRLHVYVLWNPVCALGEAMSNCQQLCEFHHHCGAAKP